MSGGIPRPKTRYHYFNFVYQYNRNSMDYTQNVYVGNKKQAVTKRQIDKNKPVDSKCVLVGCHYLGLMTRAEFTEGE